MVGNGEDGERIRNAVRKRDKTSTNGIKETRRVN